jgi:hypothetical protein
MPGAQAACKLPASRRSTGYAPRQRNCQADDLFAALAPMDKIRLKLRTNVDLHRCLPDPCLFMDLLPVPPGTSATATRKAAIDICQSLSWRLSLASRVIGGESRRLGLPAGRACGSM